MSRPRSWLLGLVGALAVGAIAFVSRHFVPGGIGTSKGNQEAPPPAKTVTTALPEAQVAGPVSPNVQTPVVSEQPPASGEGETKQATPDLTLGKQQRDYLWQVEHHGLILSR